MAAANTIATMPVTPQAIAPATTSVAATARERVNDWGEMLLVATTVTVDVPIAGLTVRELFRLQRGSVLASSQMSGVQVPIAIGGRVIAWGEFQVAGDHLALRVAELA
jgi:flagellar motor switch/type III secretory pathway protein FliN